MIEKANCGVMSECVYLITENTYDVHYTYKIEKNKHIKFDKSKSMYYMFCISIYKQCNGDMIEKANCGVMS